MTVWLAVHVICSALVDVSILFFKMVVPVYTPTAVDVNLTPTEIYVNLNWLKIQHSKN